MTSVSGKSCFSPTSSEAQSEYSPRTSIIGRPARGHFVSPPSHLTNGVVRLMDFVFCSLARISPTFCSVASLPIQSTPLFFLGWHLNGVGPVAKIRYQAVGFPYNRMLKLSSSKGIRIDVPVLSVSWSVEDHSCLLYTSPSPRDLSTSRMPSSA